MKVCERGLLVSLQAVVVVKSEKYRHADKSAKGEGTEER